MEAIGQYQLLRRLGSGAFATVWLAHDDALDATVAIKLLADNWVAQPDIVRRFNDEARLLWKSENPRVINVFTFGTLPTGQPWFAMEYADRGTLADRLDQNPGTRIGSLRDEVALITEMGRCIEAVHRLGAVHRDVKPSNFLIRSTTESSHMAVPGLAADERLIIGDLGLAKVVAEASGFTVAAGSPLYMPPEQTSTSAEVTYASDVYALGVCAWQILIGTAPEPQVRTAGLRAVRPDLPEAVERVIQRAVERDPEDRWPSIDEFTTALGQASEAPPPTAVPSTAAPVRTAPALKSRRIALTLGALAVLIAAVVVAALLLRDTAPTLADAPPWFELPAGVDNTVVDVRQTDDGLSIVAPPVSDFANECAAFLTAANEAGYDTVRDLCSAPDAVGSARDATGETAVMAELSDQRVGWQFAADS